MRSQNWPKFFRAIVGLACAATAYWIAPVRPSGEAEVSSFIVQGRDVAAVADLVRDAGGEVTHELKIIHAVGARLNREQLTSLEAQGRRNGTGARIYRNRTVTATVGDDDSDATVAVTVRFL